MIPVEVAYAAPDEQVIIALEVEEGTTVEQAIERSRVRERFPEIDLKKNKVGIFGKLGKLGEPLRARDRVEIYRPLIADPKEMRRQRAEKTK
ncbi:RnfH family protein [Alkalilimnicola sp. S0819]|uniref:RnfH family protein n=1 Tax=Alkalilimnicola sp. S0819 TaxID=2613922 RepID=UPI001D027B09|nr:RnfH family protein [Alkalilimnicola sp. S0819]